MKIIDISWPLTNNMTTYKNEKNVLITPTANFEQDHVRETQLSISAHSGTHIDAPSHFLKEGKHLDDIGLEKLIGQCVVLDLEHVQRKITKKDLEKFDIDENVIVLLKTKNSEINSENKFHPNFVALDESATQMLVDKKIKAVGIDYLGIESGNPEHEVHKLLLTHNILIIEGLRLQNVEPGNYTLYCLPLKLVGTEAAPARAVLISE